MIPLPGLVRKASKTSVKLKVPSLILRIWLRIGHTLCAWEIRLNN